MKILFYGYNDHAQVWLDGLSRLLPGTQLRMWQEGDDAPADYIAAQIRGIAGLEIPISRIEGKWKVSQNRSEADRRGVLAGLRADGVDAMADIIATGLPE